MVIPFNEFILNDCFFRLLIVIVIATNCANTKSWPGMYWRRYIQIKWALQRQMTILFDEVARAVMDLTKKSFIILISTKKFDISTKKIQKAIFRINYLCQVTSLDKINKCQCWILPYVDEIVSINIEICFKYFSFLFLSFCSMKTDEEYQGLQFC